MTTVSKCLVALSVSLLLRKVAGLSLGLQTSPFLGRTVITDTLQYDRSYENNIITMRKQKASNKRTRRLQKGGKDQFDADDATTSDFISSSLKTPTATSSWDYKSISSSKNKNSFPSSQSEGGRGRSRKRSQLYNSLSSYHSHFLKLITAEFLAEVCMYCHFTLNSEIYVDLVKRYPSSTLRFRRFSGEIVLHLFEFCSSCDVI